MKKEQSFTHANQRGTGRTYYDPAVGPARGLLRRSLEPQGVFAHSRREAEAGLQRWVAHYWMVSWAMEEGQQHIVESLPHPNVHLVFTGGHTPSVLVHGVPTKKFTRELAGTERVFGVKFRAGRFRGFLGRQVATIADKTIPAEDIFGEEVWRLVPLLTGDGTEEEKVAAANRFLLVQPTVQQGGYRKSTIRKDEVTEDLADACVQQILDHPQMTKQAQLAAWAGCSERTLQRLFLEYVGVSPKWVIRRYRMHEFVERMHGQTGPLDWAGLASELGYFDQSHMIQDFRHWTGYTPQQYMQGRSNAMPATVEARQAKGTKR